MSIAEDLQASKDRLAAAGISVAVWSDGSYRLVCSNREIAIACLDGARVFSPQEMFDYVRMSDDGRALVRSLKGLR